MFAVLLFAQLAIARPQDSARVPYLELESLYETAHLQSPRLTGARALAQAAAARVSSARTLPDPQVQLGFMNYRIPGLRPMDPLGMTQFQVMQMVPGPGKLRLAGDAAAARAESASQEARGVEWDVRNQVAMVFYDLYATDQNLAVSRETLRLLQDTRAIAEAMYRVGDGRQTDVLRAQVEIARMVEDTVRMTTMRTGMTAHLNALLDRPTNSLVQSPLLPHFPDSLFSVDEILGRSEADRPMLRAAQSAVHAASAETKLAYREIWPDLTIGVQYGRQRSEMGIERMGSLMLGASLPVFAGRRQLKMRDEAAAMQQMARADLTAMRAQTQADVTTTYSNLVRARNLAALYNTTIIPQAEATVASALAAYRVGGVDFMTLLDDRMTLNKYKQDLFALQADQGKAWAELEMLVGQPLLNSVSAGRTLTTGGNRP
jgi:outer membrane protein, heavy metal efflux system